VSWFGGRRREPERPRPAAPAAEAVPEPAPEVHRSLALAELLAELPPESRLSVLDLGPAVGANLEFLSARWRCRLQVADLWRSAGTHRLADPEADPAALFRELLPFDAAPAIDLVLAWDLLNYLRRDQIRALAEHLAPACRAGGRLFAMVLTGREIPRQPLTYELREGGDLVYRGGGASTRPGPRYRPAEIDSSTPGFAVDRSYLLRHGIQEYILVRRDPDASPPEPAGWVARTAGRPGRRGPNPGRL
jgi:hypothetical protein